MKKVLFSAMVFAMCLFIFACGEDVSHNREPVKEDVPVTAIESAPGEDIQQVVLNEEDEEGKIIINSDFMEEALGDSMELDSKDIEFYHVSSFSDFDKKNAKYYMVSEVRMYDTMTSLIILGVSSGKKACWLVNYDKNNRYKDSLTAGYSGNPENEKKTESIININSAPYYIDITNTFHGSKETVKVEALPSGQFSDISRTNAGSGA